jgi:hypothetical protein
VLVEQGSAPLLVILALTQFLALLQVLAVGEEQQAALLPVV